MWLLWEGTEGSKDADAWLSAPLTPVPLPYLPSTSSLPLVQAGCGSAKDKEVWTG